MLKALVAEQMLVTILTEVDTRFRSRCVKLCLMLGAKDKRAAARIVRASLILYEVERHSRESCKHHEESAASTPEKKQHNNTLYDLKASPSRYLEPTLLLCRELGPELCKFSSCPTRSSCMPCHVKFNTESIAQILLPHKRCMESEKALEGMGERHVCGTTLSTARR